MSGVVTEIEESVVEDIRSRRELGRAKYGNTMDRGDLSMRQWLQAAYEECLDQAIYLKRCIREERAREDAALAVINNPSDPRLFPECPDRLGLAHLLKSPEV